MRIAHIVSYISVDNAFGGPVSVAVNQARELANRGHTVDILAGWDGSATLEVPNVTVRLFRTRKITPRSFSGLIAPSLWFYLLRSTKSYDAIHIHIARDAATLISAVIAQRLRTPYVLQAHGMIMPDNRLLAKLIDAMLTRPALRGSKHIFVLTDHEAHGTKAVAKKAIMQSRITNGISTENRVRGIIRRNEVLFLARLHPVKRVMAFAQMAKMLIHAGTSASFHVVGPDEGELDDLEQFIRTEGLDGKLKYEGPIALGEAPSRMATASVYVLPSASEFFPMAVLEAMSVGTPTVTTENSGLAQELSARGASLVTDGSEPQLASAVQTLLTQPTVHSQVAEAASRAISELYSIAAVADDLERVYCR